MPLITRRSSTRGLPRVSVGRCGLIFENCAFVSQNWSRLIYGSFSEAVNHATTLVPTLLWVRTLIERARKAAVAQGFKVTEVCTCYEAGYDGFWLHRFLESQGMRNSVLDSASIQVSRRRRRLKTDRTDAGSLIRVFMAWHRGEHQACSVVHVPTPEEEDMKRLHRSRANLLRDRVRHVNRIRGLLFLQGVAHIHPNRAGWMIALRDLRTRDGRAFPVQLMHEIERAST